MLTRDEVLEKIRREIGEEEAVAAIGQAGWDLIQGIAEAIGQKSDQSFGVWLRNANEIEIRFTEGQKAWVRVSNGNSIFTWRQDFRNGSRWPLSREEAFHEIPYNPN